MVSQLIPFFSTYQMEGGTGMLHDQNGYVQVDRDLGKGSCFKLSFEVLSATKPTAQNITPHLPGLRNE
jgi:hypothetical protein